MGMLLRDLDLLNAFTKNHGVAACEEDAREIVRLTKGGMSRALVLSLPIWCRTDAVHSVVRPNVR